MPNWYARALVKRFGTLQEAERHYGFELVVPDRKFTTAHLREVAARVNVKLTYVWPHYETKLIREELARVSGPSVPSVQ